MFSKKAIQKITSPNKNEAPEGASMPGGAPVRTRENKGKKPFFTNPIAHAAQSSDAKAAKEVKRKSWREKYDYYFFDRCNRLLCICLALNFYGNYCLVYLYTNPCFFIVNMTIRKR